MPRQFAFLFCELHGTCQMLTAGTGVQSIPASRPSTALRMVSSESHVVAHTPTVVRDQSGKKYSMDDYQIRQPTNVADVARGLYDLARESHPHTP